METFRTRSPFADMASGTESDRDCYGRRRQSGMLGGSRILQEFAPRNAEQRQVCRSKSAMRGNMERIEKNRTEQTVWTRR